ncbi:formate dehydrogenase accessory sulfurtransferase FdhD [Martelella alba]|uniref:Sulfur carrier protein FdhD n=1 Tax=Martelella alba TaxID=2590451 RepID=A0A506UB54_9HYPH|nr:formate dehydrogenase accessory sulfurtransferase FdhD [Martelella alba]TPW31160.1 formate dehydrogenase accessory sulfurtransferase FdhD [Martelella alba]
MMDRDTIPISLTVPSAFHGPDGAGHTERVIAAEAAIAMSYRGSSHAVMMATPSDLEDFAVGFSLTEGIIDHPDEITGIEVLAFEAGIELQISLADEPGDAFVRRRRSMAGPVGCGLCGLESLDAAMRSVPAVAEKGLRLTEADIHRAVDGLSALQPLFAETRAVHGAGFFHPDHGIVMVREDVGRHNALDKLIGGMARGSISAANGAIVVTSRLSVEMVQKAAICGAPVLIAISAPTALAIETAENAGITLVAIARRDGFSVFTRAERIV